jgi:hypothetical protein
MESSEVKGKIKIEYRSLTKGVEWKKSIHKQMVEDIQ